MRSEIRHRRGEFSIKQDIEFKWEEKTNKLKQEALIDLIYDCLHSIVVAEILKSHP